MVDAKNVGVKKGFTNGISVGLVYFVMFGAYALGFWYGSVLIRDETYSIGKVLIVSLLYNTVRSISMIGIKILKMSHFNDSYNSNDHP